MLAERERLYQHMILSRLWIERSNCLLYSINRENKTDFSCISCILCTIVTNIVRVFLDHRVDWRWNRVVGLSAYHGEILEFLPPALDEDTLCAFATSQGLPIPISIQTLTVTAEYHLIYGLSFSPDDGAAISPLSITFPGSVDLIFCVSSQHVPHIKTENEVAFMTWVKESLSRTGFPTCGLLLTLLPIDMIL